MSTKQNKAYKQVQGMQVVYRSNPIQLDGHTHH